MGRSLACLGNCERPIVLLPVVHGAKNGRAENREANWGWILKGGIYMSYYEIDIREPLKGNDHEKNILFVF